MVLLTKDLALVAFTQYWKTLLPDCQGTGCVLSVYFAPAIYRVVKILCSCSEVVL
jgi:hypothetical protein